MIVTWLFRFRIRKQTGLRAAGTIGAQKLLPVRKSSYSLAKPAATPSSSISPGEPLNPHWPLLPSLKEAILCYSLRIHFHRVFLVITSQGKGSSGWFYDLKLLLISNQPCQLVRFLLIPFNNN
ncbi:transposase [Pontibacter ummariensis]|uniref:transposase n=1 Tax=Pontibacter ummariensis TaxID=1610492 RepID=UPI001185E27B|nr:transposase [Pontibacter ummariensis]